MALDSINPNTTLFAAEDLLKLGQSSESGDKVASILEEGQGQISRITSALSEVACHSISAGVK